MKCLERLVLPHITACHPSISDLYQFTYRVNRSTEDATATALQSVLSQLSLFIDYSSAFHTIIPDTVITKLLHLSFLPTTCSWTNRPQAIKFGPHLSSIWTPSTGSPQSCVSSPLLYSLYTHDCNQHTQATPLSSLLTTKQWLDSFQRGKSLHAGTKS